MKSSRQTILALIAAGLLLWAAFSVATYLGWIHGADHRDFYPWWAAARLHFFQGLDPYALDTTRQMQLMLYGHVIPPNLDQQGFAYPAQLLVLLFPFWLIQDVEIASAIWSGLAALLVIASLLIVTRSLTSSRSILVFIGLILWQYPLLMLFQVQITALPLFCLVGSYWAYIHKRDFMAGFLLSLLIIKPDLAAFSWCFILGAALCNRRYRMIAAFLGTEIILFVLSILALGWWVPGWLASISRYSGYAQSTWPLLTAWNIHPALLLSVLLIAGFVVFTIRQNFIVLFGASVALSLLFLPHTPIWNLTMLLLPLSLAWQGWGRWVVALTWLLGWAFFPYPGTWQIQYLVFPLLSLAALALANREQPQAVGQPVTASPAG